MESKGIARTKGSLALTLLSSAELISYILASSVGDRLKGSLIVINIIAATFLSFVCFLWTFIDTDYYLINGLCVVLGAGLGLTIVYQFAASAEITGMSIDTAWPLTNLWSGIGVLFGPLFSGAIYDIRHQYHDVFYVMAGIYLFQLLIFSVIYYRRRRRRVWDSIVDYSELVEDRGASNLRKASVDKISTNNFGELSDSKCSSNGTSNPYRLDESNGLYKTTQFDAQNSQAEDTFQCSLINSDCYSYQNGSGLNPFRTTHHAVQPE